MAKRKLTRQQRDYIRSQRTERKEQKAAPSSSSASIDTSAPSRTGLIIAHHGASVVVEDDQGQLRRCLVRQKLEALVCGDRVLWQPTADGEGVVVERQARDSLLARPTPGGGSKPYAANLNRIFIVTSLRPKTDDALIDRYLVVAETTEIHPVIVINKSDLTQAQDAEEIQARMDKYQPLGYEVLLTSVKKQHGLDALIDELKGHTSILVGQSGVGKSSLVKTLLPDREIRIGALSEADQGRHTTTTSVLYHLPFGGDLIDSPGVRDFAVWHIEPRDVAWGFVEFRAYLGHCRFSNCSHTNEPGFALLEARTQGRIHPERLTSYHQMMLSLEQPRR